MGEKRSACAEREYDYSVGLNAFTVIDSFLYMELEFMNSIANQD